VISAIIVLGIQKDVLSESTYTRSFHLFACNYYSTVIFAFLPIFSPSCCLSSCWSLFSQQLVSSQPSSVSPLSHPPSARTIHRTSPATMAHPRLSADYSSRTSDSRALSRASTLIVAAAQTRSTLMSPYSCARTLRCPMI